MANIISVPLDFPFEFSEFSIGSMEHLLETKTFSKFASMLKVPYFLIEWKLPYMYMILYFF